MFAVFIVLHPWWHTRGNQEQAYMKLPQQSTLTADGVESGVDSEMKSVVDSGMDPGVESGIDSG